MERFVPDEVHASSRGQFERDRARILHSSALRRLGTKTQVLRAGFDDFVRTRLTHSLEVAQVGRGLARQLGCDEDIVDAACLSHDIGHPPFGHNGEKALNDIAKDIGGFEGNAQTFRLLTRLEPKIFTPSGESAGLNLTRATLDATVKYPWTLAEAADFPTDDATTKFNIYEDDLPVFEWIKATADPDNRHRKCLEAQVMDFSDDVSYCVHDIEDALVSGAYVENSLSVLDSVSEQHKLFGVLHSWYGDAFTDDELIDAIGRLKKLGITGVEFTGSRRSLSRLKNMTSTLIGRFCEAAVRATQDAFGSEPLRRYSANLVVPAEIKAEIQILKGFSAAYVMAPRDELSGSGEEQAMIHDLADKFMNGYSLDAAFTPDFKAAESDSAKLRVVVDQIACLTDFSARQIANGLVGVV
jgi:dGTPase